MLARLKPFFSFIRSVFSEGEQGSFSRVIQGFIVVMTCGWVSYVVLRTHAIPDLAGPSMIIGTGGVHYGVNKLPDILNALKGKNTDNGQKTDGQQ